MRALAKNAHEGSADPATIRLSAGGRPIGEQKLRMKLPPGRTVPRVELLRAEAQAPFRQSGGMIEFTIPKVVDYEVAALYSA